MSSSFPVHDEKFIFEDTEHYSSFSEKLLIFYKEHQLFDTTIVAGSERIRIGCHRIVLSVFSEFFFEIFRQTSSSGSRHKIKLKEIDATALKLIIDFMYSGWIELHLENIKILLRTASFLKMKNLTDACCDFIIRQNIDYDNCIKWISLAKELGLSVLKEQSLRFINKNLKKILKKKTILLLNRDVLKDVIFNDNRQKDLEEYVFLALVAWIEYDDYQRQEHLLQLLPMVRYKYLTPEFIKEHISVCKTVESYALCCSWLEWHLTSQTSEGNCNLNPRAGNTNQAVAFIKRPDSEDIMVQTYNHAEDSLSSGEVIHLVNKKRGHSVIVINEKLLIVGGNNDDNVMNLVECIDLRTLKLTDLPPMKYGRTYSHLANMNGNLVVAGGLNEEMGFVDTMEVYNFSTNKWYEHELKAPSFRSRMVCQNEIVYILNPEAGVLQSYDVFSKQLTSKTIMNKNLQRCGFAMIGEFAYIIGGSDNQNESLKSVKRYNLNDGTWSDVGVLLKDRSRVHVEVVDGKIFVREMDSEEKFDQWYDPETDTWKSLES